MMIAQSFLTNSSYNFPTVDYQLTSRRQVLTAVGTGTTVALAGCSNNGQEGSSNDDSGSGGNGTDSPSGSGGNGSGTEETDSGSTSSTGNEPGEYPRQETNGLEAELDKLADEDPVYSFTIDDYDFLNVEEFPEVERDDLSSYNKALYFATSFEDSRPTEEIYFICDSRDEAAKRSISMYYRGEGGNFDPGNGIAADEGTSDMSQEEFFRDHVDPDGIVHAVDLAEHDYAVEALHSGFGSE